jgi:UDP-N-acetyl-D-glucosamine dehydrogenase
MVSLLTRLQRREATVGVMGLGYVGLPLAVEFARVGFHVIGFEVNRERVSDLNRGRSHIPAVAEVDLRQLVNSGHLRATDDLTELARVDTVSICVPTPLRKTQDPDISFVMDAATEIARTLHPEQLVVLESTTYPGTTEELLLPLFSRTGLRAGEDFYLAFSPERIDPGSQHYTIRNTPKVVGGITPLCTQLAMTLYSAAVEQVTPVSSPKVAELVKLLENTFRAVNIGLVNELAQIANILGINIWEVIDAAATKPFGFMPFYPGPGLGGHCIPIDPEYLAWKLRTYHYRARFIELAGEVNREMPRFVVGQVMQALNEQGKCLKGARIVALGVTYKRDVSDMRESPALDVLELLHDRGAHITYVDAHVPEVRLSALTLRGQPLSDDLLAAADCVLVLTDHTGIDYAHVARVAPLVIDTRNAAAQAAPSPHLWPLVRPQRPSLPRRVEDVLADGGESELAPIGAEMLLASPGADLLAPTAAP